MAVPLNAYFLYKVNNNSHKVSMYLLLKIIKPAFSNAVESEGEEAEEILEKNRERILTSFMSQNNFTSNELIGQFEGEPEGDFFYEDHGMVDIEFWIAKSDFGFPWIIISGAPSEEEFWRVIGEDIFLSNMRALKPSEKIKARFITEQDY